MALITICGRRHGLPKPPDRRKAPVVAKKRTPSNISVKSQTPTHSDLRTPELFCDLNSRNTSFLVSSQIVRNQNGLFLSNLISSRSFWCTDLANVLDALLGLVTCVFDSDSLFEHPNLFPNKSVIFVCVKAWQTLFIVKIL